MEYIHFYGSTLHDGAADAVLTSDIKCGAEFRMSLFIALTAARTLPQRRTFHRIDNTQLH